MADVTETSRAPAGVDVGSTALVTAAESFLRTHTGETVDGVVATRALGHYWESIRQYLTIRVGAERGLSALTSMTNAGHGGASLVAPPGPRARLFREARSLVEPIGDEPGELPWWTPPNAGRAAALRAVRGALGARERELLELRYTRALTVDEIAYVLGEPVHAIDAALRAARARGERVLRASGIARRDVEDCLREAFALERGPALRPAAPRLEVGDVISDRYDIESHLGSGAFADVYRARDREVPDHVVALKIRRDRSEHEASRAVARRELRLIASVFHPSIVQLKDHGWHDGRLWFVMPWYRGETLAARLSRGRLSRQEARQIFEPLARALAAMHRAGVRHQDIKPENIFLARLDPDRDGDDAILPVLLDLGVAVQDAEAVLAGTPGYFAPEVAALFAGIPDPPPLSDRSDVFSLALALRNALEPETTEDVVGGSVDAFVARRARRAPAPPSSRDLAYLRAHFERWLALNPDERPSAEELARELRVLTEPEERRARLLSVVRWVAPVVVTFAAVMVAGLWAASREAKFQRLEAERARQQAAAQRLIAESAQARAATIREDLSHEARMRRALEQEVEQLQRAYQSSRLTREDLVARLARAESELRLREEAHQQVSRELAALAHERDALSAQLETRDGELSQAQQRNAALVEVEQQLRRRLAEIERAREEAEQRARALRSELDLVTARPPPSPFQDDEDAGGRAEGPAADE